MFYLVNLWNITKQKKLQNLHFTKIQINKKKVLILNRFEQQKSTGQTQKKRKETEHSN